MTLTFFNTWLPFIYLYGVGGLAFLIGMYLIIKTRSLNQEKVHHKKWLFVLIAGFFYYASIHGFFILMALK
tara:strand:+ start:1859 stop:2071 length:213 start_codon:yes stop_codon:yes gene_type:complete